MQIARFLAIASLATVSLAAHAENNSRTQACVDAFIAQHFPGQTPIVRIEKDFFHRSPASYGVSFQLQLSATTRSGDLLATAVCKAKGGVVTLVPEASALIASAR